ncbi:MAG: DNA-protecting protein DprA [Chlorobium sp.]|nr:MAG: DNA-protecting protein DprA [Chlorobium sp.]
METSKRFLVLSLVPGIGPARIKAIAGHFPDLKDLPFADILMLARIHGIGEPLARQVHDFFRDRQLLGNAEKAAEEQLAKLHRIGACLLTLSDPLYPSLLREIYDPPPCLFVRGNPQCLGKTGIAVVGTRKATPYGKQCTSMFCRELAGSGAVIFSGLAYGIDMAAHTAALEASGTTVAVLAGGVDTIYTDPKGTLWPKIIEQGALVSEEWLGSEIIPAKFPKRNRVISGLSSGTLVIESDLKGGSLITAAAALEQNREVFAVPGNIFSKTSRGTNDLIQKGLAKAVMNVGDIIAELGPQFGTGCSERQESQTILPEMNFTPIEKKIVDRLDKQSVHIDVLAAESGIDIPNLLVNLFELELKGIVTQFPGQFFQKKYR